MNGGDAAAQRGEGRNLGRSLPSPFKLSRRGYVDSGASAFLCLAFRLFPFVVGTPMLPVSGLSCPCGNEAQSHYLKRVAYGVNYI